MQPTLHVLSEHRNSLGEGPWWDASRGILYWVDVAASTVHWAGLDGGDVTSLSAPGKVGFVVKTHSGGLLIGGHDGLYSHDLTEGADWHLRWQGDWDPAEVRINDGKVDPGGRLWFGTVHEPETAAIGHLYCLDRDQPHARLDGVTVSNGLGWSPDGLEMYYADSATQAIRAFDFDPSTGEIRNARVFATDAAPSDPDGLTVDADGGIWSAKWLGNKVVRYTPDGSVDREIALPVSRPTSCMFVGSDLRTLAITTALPSVPDSEPLAGAVFLLDAGVAGLPESTFDDGLLPFV